MNADWLRQKKSFLYQGAILATKKGRNYSLLIGCLVKSTISSRSWLQAVHSHVKNTTLLWS